MVVGLTTVCGVCVWCVCGVCLCVCGMCGVCGCVGVWVCVSLFYIVAIIGVNGPMHTN